MKPTNSIVVRVLVVVVATGLLLLPALMTASVWTSINLQVSMIAIVVSVLVAFWLSKWKWIGAAVASLLIAIPPYPFWLYSSEDRGWYLHFFHGYNMQNLPLGTFAIVFAIALFLFAAIFWATEGPRPFAITSRGSGDN